MPSSNPPIKNTAFAFEICLTSQIDGHFFQTNPTLADGDVKISKDGGSLANLTNLPTAIDGGKLVTVSLTAGEMNADRIAIVFADAAGSEWCDLRLELFTQTVAPGTLVDGAITAAKLANDAITAAKIADGAIDAATFAAGAIDSTALADNAITSSKLADGALASAKIADGAITNAKLAANAINSTTVADGTIDAAAFADNAITAAKIADGAIDAATFAAGAINAAALADNAITSSKLADGALASAKIADGAITSAKFTVAAITGPASGILEQLRQLWRWYFKKKTGPKDGTGNVVTYADDGTTAITTQAATISGNTETVGNAS